MRLAVSLLTRENPAIVAEDGQEEFQNLGASSEAGAGYQAGVCRAVSRIRRVSRATPRILAARVLLPPQSPITWSMYASSISRSGRGSPAGAQAGPGAPRSAARKWSACRAPPGIV